MAAKKADTDKAPESKQDPRHDPLPYPASSLPNPEPEPAVDEGRGYTYPPGKPVVEGEPPPDDAGTGQPNWVHDPANNPNYKRPTTPEGKPAPAVPGVPQAHDGGAGKAAKK